MPENVTVTVAVPCYNEEGNVSLLEKELLPVMDGLGRPYDVLLIDDGSADRTLAEMQDLRSRFPNRIRIGRHPINSGLGASIQTAIREATGEYLVLLDADLTFHPQEIPKLITEQEKTGSDCVIGSHLMHGGKAKSVDPFRLFLNKGVNILYMLASGKKLTSFSAMFRLYRTSALRKLTLDSTDFSLSAEILAKLINNGGVISEVPVELSKRTIGTSKIRFFREIKNHLILLSKIVWWRIIPA